MFEHLVKENIRICLKWKRKLIWKHLNFASSLKNSVGRSLVFGGSNCRLWSQNGNSSLRKIWLIVYHLSFVNYQCLKGLLLDIELKFILTMWQKLLKNLTTSVFLFSVFYYSNPSVYFQIVKRCRLFSKITAKHSELCFASFPWQLLLNVTFARYSMFLFWSLVICSNNLFFPTKMTTIVFSFS